MSLLSRSLLTGFIGGTLWGTIGFVFFYFNFIEMAPRAFLIQSWITADWTSTWLGHVLSILLSGVVSLVPTFIYYSMLKKINSLWAGVLYGIVLWAIVFYILNPVFPDIKALTELNRHSIVSTLTLYSLYGAFIGYSISYDYNDTQHQQNQQPSSDQ